MELNASAGHSNVRISGLLRHGSLKRIAFLGMWRTIAALTGGLGAVACWDLVSPNNKVGHATNGIGSKPEYQKTTHLLGLA